MNKRHRLAAINFTLGVGIFITGAFSSPHVEPPQIFFNVVAGFFGLATLFAAIGFI